MKGCPEFAKILAEHGGLPKDYEGALEKFLKEKGVTRAKSVTSLQDAAGDADRSDYTESEFDPAEADQQEPPTRSVQGCGSFTRSSCSRAPVAQPENASSLKDSVKAQPDNASPTNNPDVFKWGGFGR